MPLLCREVYLTEILYLHYTYFMITKKICSVILCGLLLCPMWAQGVSPEKQPDYVTGSSLSSEAVSTSAAGYAAQQAKDIVIKGNVVDANNQPIPFASIVLKGSTSVGTAADVDGNYVITVPSKQSILVFSSIGYLAQEIQVGSRAVINVALAQDSESLEEVMVVAYGTATKASFTGSAGKVKGEKIELIPNTNPLNTLNGSTPGIRLTSALGQPGADASITIRGIGSINGNTDPLIVMDGMIYSGVLSSIPSGDVESITVLKDAASTALYGARAANGVIMITTKQGKGEKPVISVKLSNGWVSREQEDYATMGIKDYMETYWRLYYNNYKLGGAADADAAAKASANVATSLNYTDEYNAWNCKVNEVVGLDGKYTNASLKWEDDLDWRGGIEQTGYVQDYSLSANGRTNKSTYFASIGYADQQGYIRGSGFERYSARANVSTQGTSWLKLGVNLAATISKRYGMQSTSQGDLSNVFLMARRMPPMYPVHLHTADGAYVLDANGQPIYDFGESYTTADGQFIPGRAIYASVNAPRQLQNRFNQQTRHMIDAKPYVDIVFLKDFKLTLNAALYNSDYQAHSATIYYQEKSSNTPSTTKTFSGTQTWALNQLLTWNKSFGRNHFDVLLGHESNTYRYNYESSSMKYQIVLGDNYEFDNYTELSSQPSSYNNTYNTEGYFARLNYNYNGKYFASASFRRDGSSKFAPESRWGNFWSLGGTWLIDQESFMKNVEWISNLKLRASIGTVGSDDLGSYYPWMALYVINQNVNEAGYTQSVTSTGNRAIQWEVSTNWDVAAEFSLFDRRLNGSVEYFHRNTSNLLMEVTLPPSTGLTSRNDNAGGLYNKGVEFVLNYDIIRTKNVNWNFGLNGTFLKNRITYLPIEPYTINSSYNKIEEGHSVYEWWLYQWAGVDPQTGLNIFELGDEYLEDVSSDIVEVNGQKYTTNMDKSKEAYSGSSIPKVSGGITTSFSWKNFTFAMDLYYQLGGKTYDRAYENSMAGIIKYEKMNLSTDLLGMWRQPGDITNIPMLTNDSKYASNIDAARSTRWLIKSDMLEVNSLSIAYSFPKKICDKLKFGSLKIYAAADHLCIWNARRGLNTNYSLSQYDSGGDRYSPARTISVGINFTL